MENKLKLGISDDFIEKTRKEVAEGQHALLVAMRERRKTMENNIRPPKELLQVFLDNQELFDTGMCMWTLDLQYHGIINEEEENYIDGMIDKEFGPLGYVWEKGDIQPRLEWLKENLK